MIIFERFDYFLRLKYFIKKENISISKLLCCVLEIFMPSIKLWKSVFAAVFFASNAVYSMNTIDLSWIASKYHNNASLMERIEPIVLIVL